MRRDVRASSDIHTHMQDSQEIHDQQRLWPRTHTPLQYCGRPAIIPAIQVQWQRPSEMRDPVKQQICWPLSMIVATENYDSSHVHFEARRYERMIIYHNSNHPSSRPRNCSLTIPPDGYGAHQCTTHSASRLSRPVLTLYSDMS